MKGDRETAYQDEKVERKIEQNCEAEQREMKDCRTLHRPTYLDITVFVLQCAPSNFEQTHRHSRANLGKLDALVPRPNKYVMPNFDAVVNVLESHNAAAHFPLSLSWRK